MTLLPTPLRRCDFGLLWLAGLISLTGTWLLLIEVPLAVYRRRASILATGTLFLATALPDVPLGPLVGDGGRSLGAPADLAGGLALLLPRAGGQVSAAEGESATRSPLAVGRQLDLNADGGSGRRQRGLRLSPLCAQARIWLRRPAGWRWRPDMVGSWASRRRCSSSPLMLLLRLLAEANEPLLPLMPFTSRISVAEFSRSDHRMALQAVSGRFWLAS